jgi:hypothetical protein
MIYLPATALKKLAYVCSVPYERVPLVIISFMFLNSRSRFTCIMDGSLVDLHSLPPWVQVHCYDGFGNTPDLQSFIS